MPPDSRTSMGKVCTAFAPPEVWWSVANADQEMAGRVPVYPVFPTISLAPVLAGLAVWMLMYKPVVVMAAIIAVATAVVRDVSAIVASTASAASAILPGLIGR